jgi:hypothetical protein
MQRSAVLAAESAKLTEASGGAIKAEVRRASNASGFAEKLRQAISGSGLQRAKVDAVG